jgi:hypothetical protein
MNTADYTPMEPGKIPLRYVLAIGGGLALALCGGAPYGFVLALHWEIGKHIPAIVSFWMVLLAGALYGVSTRRESRTGIVIAIIWVGAIFNIICLGGALAKVH